MPRLCSLTKSGLHPRGGEVNCPECNPRAGVTAVVPLVPVMPTSARGMSAFDEVWARCDELAKALPRAQVDRARAYVALVRETADRVCPEWELIQWGETFSNENALDFPEVYCGCTDEDLNFEDFAARHDVDDAVADDLWQTIPVPSVATMNAALHPSEASTGAPVQIKPEHAPIVLDEDVVDTEARKRALVERLDHEHLDAHVELAWMAAMDVCPQTCRVVWEGSDDNPDLVAAPAFECPHVDEPNQDLEVFAVDHDVTTEVPHDTLFYAPEWDLLAERGEAHGVEQKGDRLVLEMRTIAADRLGIARDNATALDMIMKRDDWFHLTAEHPAVVAAKRLTGERG